MKKPAICALAIIVGFTLSELVVGQIVGYPRYVTGRRDYIIHDSLGPYNKITMWPPYYSTWSVEGGNNVVSRNNIGFYGADVESDSDSKYVLLLGNSFIEAGQYPGNEIAAGYLQRSISNVRSDLQVINLGASGHDPYVLWYRLLFFEQTYKPEKVLLICESFERLKHYFSRWAGHSSQYSESISVKEIMPDKLTITQRIMRNRSSLLNLLGSLISYYQQDLNNNSIETNGNRGLLSNEEAFKRLQIALQNYSSKYKEGFLFVSLMRDNPYQEELQEYCLNNRINYSYNGNIMIPSNLINGQGHLNISGNQELGYYLGKILVDYMILRNTNGS